MPNRPRTSLDPSILFLITAWPALIAVAPTASAEPSAADQRHWSFPEINQAFSGRSELQREPFVASVKGARLSGWGSVTEVGRCGFMDDSKRHGRKCLKVTLDKDVPRAVLFFAPSKESELAALEVGNAYRFSDCEILDLVDFGFWTTVTCDMP